MKFKQYYILALLISSIVFITSCNLDVDKTTQWRMQNDAEFKSYGHKEGYLKTTIDGYSPFIYMKWIERGKSKSYPIETSRVEIHYECHLLTGDKTFIDGNMDQETPTKFGINRSKKEKVIMGMRIALQNMVVGDEVEAIIPWYLAYGDESKGSILPYSALSFKIKLENIIPEEN